MNTGVYVIEHTASGKKYIGSAAKSFDQRWGNHRRTLRKGTHKNTHLQRAWNKYGEDAFVFRIVKRTAPEEAIESEQAYIDLHQACDPKHGYNIAPIAGSNLGVKHTDETKAKLSAAMMGNKRKLGHKASAETRAKKSAAQIGKKRGPHSPETIAKMTGQKRSEQMKARMSALASSWQKGRKLTAEHCANMSAAGIGKTHTAETRAKMSAAQTSRYAAKKEATTCLARD